MFHYMEETPMDFETWLQECRSILIRTLQCSEEFAQKIIEGSGIDIYRHQFNRKLTPQQCVDKELIYWNE